MLLNRLFLSFCLLLPCLGCQHKEPQVVLTLTEAQKKFEQKCRDEFDLHVITKMVGKTFWIYLPIKEPIFDYESQKETSGDANKKQAKFAVQYVDGDFKDNQFAFEYDVISRKKSKAEDYGYNSSYTDSYVKAQNNLFTTISDIFFNTATKNTSAEPDFFVIVITDIKKGIETRATFYLEDFKRYMSGDLPYEEYMKRFLADTKGGQSFVGDETGSHVQYKSIVMPDFLAKQIINRINFKFHSESEPPDDYDTMIAGIVADTTRYYRFDKFANVKLHNLRNDKTFNFNKALLAPLGDDPAGTKDGAPKGKLIHIRFDNGKAQFDEPVESSAPVTTNKEE